jgi:hypothetical protein
MGGDRREAALGFSPRVARDKRRGGRDKLGKVFTHGMCYMRDIYLENDVFTLGEAAFFFAFTSLE